MKQNMHLTEFTTTGLKQVNTEFKLYRQAPVSFDRLSFITGKGQPGPGINQQQIGA